MSEHLQWLMDFNSDPTFHEDDIGNKDEAQPSPRSDEHDVVDAANILDLDWLNELQVAAPPPTAKFKQEDNLDSEDEASDGDVDSQILKIEDVSDSESDSSESESLDANNSDESSSCSSSDEHDEDTSSERDNREYNGGITILSVK